MIEIEENIKDGVVVKRLINGIEFPVDDLSFVERIHEVGYATIKQVMSVEEAKKRFGDLLGSHGTS